MQDDTVCGCDMVSRGRVLVQVSPSNNATQLHNGHQRTLTSRCSAAAVSSSSGSTCELNRVSAALSGRCCDQCRLVRILSRATKFSCRAAVLHHQEPRVGSELSRGLTIMVLPASELPTTHKPAQKDMGAGHLSRRRAVSVDDVFAVCRASSADVRRTSCLCASDFRCSSCCKNSDVRQRCFPSM